MSELDTPTDLRYTAEHEWVKRTGPTSVRVGITDFAQSQLGDVVFVQLPAVDEDVTAGESLGEVESTKSVSDIFAPFTAKVLAANGELDGQPDLVNTDPYDTGWLVNSRLPTRPHSTPHSRQLWTRRHTRDSRPSRKPARGPANSCCVAACLAAHGGLRRVRSLGTHVPSRGAGPYRT